MYELGFKRPSKYFVGLVWQWLCIPCLERSVTPVLYVSRSSFHRDTSLFFAQPDHFSPQATVTCYDVPNENVRVMLHSAFIRECCVPYSISSLMVIVKCKFRYIISRKMVCNFLNPSKQYQHQLLQVRAGSTSPAPGGATTPVRNNSHPEAGPRVGDFGQ